MLLAFLSWWYTSGWVGCFNRWIERYRNLAEYFSVSTLLSTLFNPFRQISYRPANKSLDARFHTMLENLFSRVMGAIVRTMIIFTALLVYVLAFPLFIAELLLWPLIPMMWFIIPAIVILFGGQS
jgi:hypothetical protein